MITAKNGDIIAAGVYEHPFIHPKERAFVMRFSADGKRKWSHYYINSDFPLSTSDILDIAETENGDLVCLGDVNNKNGEWNNSYYTWLFRVDSMGCMEPGCELADSTTGVMVDVNEIYFSEVNNLKLYPNPVHNSLTVELPTEIPWRLYSIVDISGRSIATKTITEKLLSIDVSSLNKGIYFIRVLSKDGKMGIGKFVVK